MASGVFYVADPSREICPLKAEMNRVLEANASPEALSHRLRRAYLQRSRRRSTGRYS